MSSKPNKQKPFALLLFFLSLLFLKVTTQSLSNMDSAMETHQIVPDVIDKAPSVAVQVYYGDGVFVDQGKELTPTQVQNEPSKVLWPSEPDVYYTLCMTDPDAPSRAEPTKREVLHWLVGNILGNDFSKGEVIAQYIGSGAPQGTGLHRYVFLVYKQNGMLAFDESRISNRSREGRINFSIRKFASKYNLSHPIAGNFFQAQYDDYVPKLHAQLSGQTVG